MIELFRSKIQLKWVQEVWARPVSWYIYVVALTFLACIHTFLLHLKQHFVSDEESPSGSVSTRGLSISACSYGMCG